MNTRSITIGAIDPVTICNLNLPILKVLDLTKTANRLEQSAI
jgi:hypothetical protein